MKKGRPAVIKFSEESIWPSCRIIVPNLLRSCALAFEEKLNVFNVSRSQKDVDTVARQIHSARPNKLIFVDHHIPHPGPLVRALRRHFSQGLPPVYVHVYGDFILAANGWYQLDAELKDQPVHFVCASPRHRKLVASTLRGGERFTSVCPFPVDSKQYFHSPQIRRSARRNLGFGIKDRLLAYTGRITLQKNVLRLVEEASRLMRHSEFRIHISLAGHFDNRAGPFGGDEVPGSLYRRYSEFTKSLPQSLRSRIRLLGDLHAEELNCVYNAADAFISLSTFHDDDYGMSPIEALFCGCPVVLTDWAGYSGFRMNENSTHFVPVRIDQRGLLFSSDSVQNALNRALESNVDEEGRTARSELFQKKFSIEGVAQIMRDNHREAPPPFAGFSELMQKIAFRMSRKEETETLQKALFPEGLGKDSFYHRVYQSYLHEQTMRRDGGVYLTASATTN